MKPTKWMSIVCGAIIFAGCFTVSYLPNHKTLDSNPYGAYIRINTVDKKYYAGELISVTGDKVTVLLDEKGIISTKTIDSSQIKRYYLIYANKSSARSIPFIISIFHGFFFPITTLINGLVMANADFTYTSKSLKYKDLKLFARYPQGIPDNISIYDIK